MTPNQLKGIIPPLPTPFDEQGDFAPALQKKLIAELEPDVDGFLILGSNGEAAYLDEDERTQVLENARAAIPATKPLIAGTGGESTRSVLRRNRMAKEVGADFALVLPPFYFKGLMNYEILKTHFLRVADESPLPVLLYNVPPATTISLSPDLIAELAEHENIVGLKDSAGNVGALTETFRQVPATFKVFTGNAPTLLPALSLGAIGGILAVANVLPQAYQSILEMFKSGNIEAARDLQLRHNPLALAVTSRHGVPGLKAALKLQGKDAGLPRAPLLPASDSVTAELKQLLA